MSNTICNSFPGYECVWNPEDKKFHNMYRGDDIGKGGWIYSEEGIWTDVALLDIQSMHPNSAVSMNVFGEYTQRFKDILDARVAIKHGDYDKARQLFDGRLAPYLEDKSTAKDLSQALKISINSVYGLTSANFDNPFRDLRNKNNIVALKGALFMRTLQDEVKKRGFTVASIRTDSIKIPNATLEIIQFCSEFAAKYGYIFEHECTYSKLCLVNKSAYIAEYASIERCKELYGDEYVYKDDDTLKENKKHPKTWSATATQFQVPFVFKTLFSKEPIEFEDFCEVKEVKTAIYLDMNEGFPDVSKYEKECSALWKDITDISSIQDADREAKRNRIDELEELISNGHDYHFIGKVGNFCPIKPGCGGGILVREAKAKDGSKKYDSVTGTLRPDGTPYRWLEAEAVKALGKEADIDKSYYIKLVDDAVEAISQYGDFERFVADEPYTAGIAGIDFPPDEDPPWYTDEELKAIQEAEREGLPYYITPELAKILDENAQDDTFNKR